MPTAIEFNNISKLYRLGLVSSGTLSHDLNRWWQMNILGKEDPFLKVGAVNDRSKAADSEYVWALKDINFKVEQGDVVGIIGKNGAGKSTLLKLLSRVTGPTTGTIKAKGRIGSLLEVGTGFHPEMTGRENIYLNGAILGMTKQEITRKLDEIVDFSGCERYIDTPVKRYSSGMMVRLGFAVAAHLDPEILVVDEVLAVGDAEFQKKAIGKMQDVSQGEGRTVLFVSHNMSSIRALCKHGVLLENGSVKYMGAVNDVVNNYLAINSENIDFDISIAQRTDRRGDGKIRVKNVVFRDSNNKIVDEVFVGDALTVEMHIDIEKNIDLSELILSCGFEDVYGNRANEWVSDEIEHDFSKLGDGKITLFIPSLTIRPNNYFFHFKLLLKNTDDRSICDAMHLVKKLHVMPYATYENGMRLKEGRGFEAVIPARFV
jgi:lipopolysaccharide transport system ATP-binding protein